MDLGEITTLDSWAEESVWPRDWLWEEPTMSTMRDSAEPNKFVAANGQEMGRYGSNVVMLTRQGGADIMSVGFEVTDVGGAPEVEGIRKCRFRYVRSAARTET